MNFPDQDNPLKWAALAWFLLCWALALRTFWRGVTRINRNVYLPLDFNGERSEPRGQLLARGIVVLVGQALLLAWTVLIGDAHAYLMAAVWGPALLLIAWAYVRWLHAKLRAAGRKVRD